MPTSRPKRQLNALVAIITVVVLVAITLTSVGAKQSVAADPLISHIDPAATQQFAALDRSAQPRDALVQPAVPGVERQAHANRALARRGDDGSTRFGVWIVPGQDALCAVVKGDADQEAIGESCQSLVDAAKGFVFTLSGGASGSPTLRPHEVVVAGVVPDGVSQVVLTMSNGARRGLQVTGNTYLADVDGATSAVTFTGPNGPVSQQATSYEG